MPDPQDMHEICARLDRGEIDRNQFLESFTRDMTALIGCTRAGVWLFIDTADGRALRCMAMYDRARDQMVSATDMSIAYAQAYFDTLLRDGAVVAPDARTDPTTQVFLATYLLPLDIHSILDVSFSVNGVMFGIFSCEQVGAPARWTQRQLQWLRQIGSRASLTLLNAATAQAETDMDPLWEPSTPNRLRTLHAPLETDDAEPDRRA
jgi:GAF domain-containing protein